MFENKYEPQAGRFLVSEPFLRDPDFTRTVILLTEHDDEGSMGFVLGKTIQVDFDEMFPYFSQANVPVYLGGPVGQNTLHFVHNQPELISEGLQIADDLYWSGNLEDVRLAFERRQLRRGQIVFFVGYSGWAGGQLRKELLQKTWIVAPENPDMVFGAKPNPWKSVLGTMLEFKHFVHYPLHPQMN